MTILKQFISILTKYLNHSVNMSKPKRLTPEQKNQEDFQRHLSNVKYAEQTENYHSTFWWTNMEEILPLWKQYLTEHPDEVDTVLRGFAWHAYYKALMMR